MAYAVTTGLHYNVAAAAYYNIPTFESRTKALLAMINERPDPFAEREKLRDTVTSLVSLAKTRNMWVHGLWTSDKKTSVTRVHNMKRPAGTRRPVQVTANAVQQHVKAVLERAEDLMDFAPVKIAKLVT